MTALEFIKKYKINLEAIHGNVGDYDGNILMENQTESGWTFWGSDGHFEHVEI